MRVIQCPSCGAGVCLENQWIEMGEEGGILQANATCTYCGNTLAPDVYPLMDANDPRYNSTPIKVGFVVTGSITNIVGPVNGPIFSGNFSKPIVIIGK